MNKKIKVHIIHHTHWDMEWYFTQNETSALLNYNIKNILNNLKEKDSGSFLFDGQTSPFEEVIKDKKLYKEMENAINANKLKIGPWYSQPDMRQTTDEGILRNYHYGQKVGNIKSNNYGYLYNPDSFGFSKNLPIIYEVLNKKNAVLWRGVNRKAINDSPVFKWKTKNNQSVNVYNIASGYFVGRYLYDDDKFENLYKNNIYPSIQRQSYNGKYSVVALPSGGDQQPFNCDLKNAIKKLNMKDDGCEYILSSWDKFFNELAPQIKDIPEYIGDLTYSYGGRVHKALGSSRPDIKQLIYKGELRSSRVLEPMLLMSKIGDEMYPKIELDKMWKNILLSQAHDAYASCNSDQVNREIKNRLLISQNIYEANKDMIIRFISQNYDMGKLLVFNPTLFEGENTFDSIIATSNKLFSIFDKNKEEVAYIILSCEKIDGGIHVMYTADGEKEIQKPDYYVSKIKIITKIDKQSIKELEVFDTKPNFIFKNNYKTSYSNQKISIFKNNEQKINMDMKMNLDAGDGYDLDMYEELQTYSLKDCEFIKREKDESNGVLIEKNYFKIKIPNSINSWVNDIRNHEMQFVIVVTLTDEIKINYSFDNIPQNLLCQTIFDYDSINKKHSLWSYGGMLTRNNNINKNDIDEHQLREKITNFDIMHGVINFKYNEKDIWISSLDVKEYRFNEDKFELNLFRTPDVLGRGNLRSRPGRASGLPDMTIQTPDSTRELNGLNFSIYINESLSNFKIIDKHLIKDLTRHNQKLYRYHNKTETWTLPKIFANKKFDKKIQIDNSKLNLIAWFKDDDNYIIRVNNPSFKTIKTNIKIYNIEEEVSFKPNQIIEWKIKI